MIKLVSMTTMCADIYDGDGSIFPGGEALNLAAEACRYNDISVSLMGAIGDDECGQSIIRSVKNLPVDISSVHIIKDGVTASNRIYLTESGDRYFKPDSWTNGVYGDFSPDENDKEKLKNSDIVFITYDSPCFNEIIKLKKSGSFALAVDFNEKQDIEVLEKYFPYIDFFFISGKDLMLPLLKKFSEKYSCIFNATLAENGSVTFCGGREYRTSAVPMSAAEDTTGCGDSYHGAFICSYALHNDIPKAMEDGAKAAAEVISHKGGFLYE